MKPWEREHKKKVKENGNWKISRRADVQVSILYVRSRYICNWIQLYVCYFYLINMYVWFELIKQRSLLISFNYLLSKNWFFIQWAALLLTVDGYICW